MHARRRCESAPTQAVPHQYTPLTVTAPHCRPGAPPRHVPVAQKVDISWLNVQPGGVGRHGLGIRARRKVGVAPALVQRRHRRGGAGRRRRRACSPVSAAVRGPTHWTGGGSHGRGQRPRLLRRHCRRHRPGVWCGWVGGCRRSRRTGRARIPIRNGRTVGCTSRLSVPLTPPVPTTAPRAPTLTPLTPLTTLASARRQRNDPAGQRRRRRHAHWRCSGRNGRRRRRGLLLHARWGRTVHPFRGGRLGCPGRRRQQQRRWRLGLDVSRTFPRARSTLATAAVAAAAATATTAAVFVAVQRCHGATRHGEARRRSPPPTAPSSVPRAALPTRGASVCASRGSARREGGGRGAPASRRLCRGWQPVGNPHADARGSHDEPCRRNGHGGPCRRRPWAGQGCAGGAHPPASPTPNACRLVPTAAVAAAQESAGGACRGRTVAARAPQRAGQLAGCRKGTAAWLPPPGRAAQDGGAPSRKNRVTCQVAPLPS